MLEEIIKDLKLLGGPSSVYDQLRFANLSAEI